MKKVACALALHCLIGCSAGKPVVLPDDLVSAATTCAAAETLYVRQNNTESDPISLEQYSRILSTPLIAAAKNEPFSGETSLRVMKGADEELNRIALLDWRAVLDRCWKRFDALDDSRGKLPADDLTAGGACFSVALFMADALRNEAPHLAADVARFDALAKRLELRVDNPANSSGLSDAQFRDKIRESAIIGFGAGDPAGFLQRCEARFPK